MRVSTALEHAVVELIDEERSAWPLVEGWAAESDRSVELLATEGDFGVETLAVLQQSTQTALGAVGYHSGGLLVDRGWLHVLGSGHHRSPHNLADFNRLGLPATAQRAPGALIVAYDVLGGFFAVNRGRFEGREGNVFYLSPETLEWDALGVSYTNWLCWALTGPLTAFYDGTRWPGWEREVMALVPGQGISFYPYLCMVGEPVAQRTRTAVALDELWRLHAVELPGTLGIGGT